MTEFNHHADYIPTSERTVSVDLQTHRFYDRILAAQSISALELYCLPDKGHELADSDTISQSLDQLEARGYIRKNYDNLTFANNVVVHYEHIEQAPLVVGVSPVAHPAIQQELASLHQKAWKKPGWAPEKNSDEFRNINFLNAEEWCLRYILEQADRTIKSGELEIDLSAVKEYLIFGEAGLVDEGLEKWCNAFDKASARAIALFETAQKNQ